MQMLLLFKDGTATSQVADLLGYSDRQVRRWWPPTAPARSTRCCSAPTRAGHCYKISSPFSVRRCPGDASLQSTSHGLGPRCGIGGAGAPPGPALRGKRPLRVALALCRCGTHHGRELLLVHAAPGRDMRDDLSPTTLGRLHRRGSAHRVGRCRGASQWSAP